MVKKMHRAFNLSILSSFFCLSTESFSTPAAPVHFVRRTFSSRLVLGLSERDEYDDSYYEEAIDPDSLGDWRDFRRSLTATSSNSEEKKISRDNLELLKSQNTDLADEFASSVWAHQVATPEVGGLLVRLPLEVELYRNYRHSVTGQKLRKTFKMINDSTSPTYWYGKAQSLIEQEMLEIADNAGDDGQVDVSTLDGDSAELLTLYLDNQENWQEVCLVLSHNPRKGTASSVVLNRPMAMKLTNNLAQLVLYGGYENQSKTARKRAKIDLIRFMMAFGQEIGVYVGGPDDQDDPAEIVHGHGEILGAKEISPGSGIFRGGLEGAIEGVLKGTYKPLDFRFFIGKHVYEESMIELVVHLGKYQPVACARSIALKQCLSLPKPLWHEVMELCGGELQEISELELQKRDDLKFQIIDEDEDDDIPDELDELMIDDDDDYDDEDDSYYSGR